MTLKEKFILNFIEDNRWQYITNGLLVTLKVTFFSAIIGILLGFLVAVIRSAYDKNYKDSKYKTFGYYCMRFVNFICHVYLTVIRGTPVVVQLLIIYFIIFGSVSIDKSIVAIMAFGINSGAYVAEIVRSGITSIDVGQTEAGRSLGFSFAQTMIYIIIPQAFRNILPALANEFIVLLKETSVAGYIALEDLAKGGYIIQGLTFDPFMPLLTVAAIYLIMVMILTRLVALLERRLSSSDR